VIGIWNLLFPEKSKLCSRRESGAKASKAGGLGVTPTPTLGPFFYLWSLRCVLVPGGVIWPECRPLTRRFDNSRPWEFGLRTRFGCRIIPGTD
jgi:hypothetical protein